MTKRYSFVRPLGGTDYEWSADHTYVKVSAHDTDGHFTLMEDNLKSTFALGLHRHDHHAETFYILEGSLDFFVDGDWITAQPGSCLHIPPGVPHACVLTEATESARMLMIFQPAGFDLYLAELGELSVQELNNPLKMEELARKYDIINLGDVPERSTATAR